MDQADELQKIANDSAKKTEVLMAEVARVRSQLESEASASRTELRKAMELEEKLAKAERVAEDKQAQLLQLQDKAATLEKEAGEYKERFLQTSRRLDAATKEACELRAAIDGLRSERQLLHEAHRQAVGAEKTASAQVVHHTEDKNKLLRELGDIREERDKAKKAVEDLAAALREMSSEARDATERVLAKQAELDIAQLQMSELTAMMGSESKSSKDDWISNEMSSLMESLRVAEKEVQELRADKTQLLSKLQELEVQATNTEEANSESSHLKDLLSFKGKELLALNHELTELRLREQAASDKASEATKLLAEMTERKAEEESIDKVTKLEMDNVLGSLRAAEAEAKAAKEEKAQLQNKLRQLEAKITEANLTSEEAKIRSLRLKETLEDKEHELASIAQENREMRAREEAAHARIDELAVLLAEAAAGKGGGELMNGAAAVARSPEKQPSVLLKLICSPMHHDVRDDDESNGEIVQMEDIKHLDEVETVRQVKREKERGVSAVDDASSLEKSKFTEEDLFTKERDGVSESSDDDDDDDIESAGDDALVDQMNGLLINGPTSSFNQDQHIRKKKRALLKKFGSLLKKKAHFTKLSSHS